jgi:phosphate transport system substrate-binding protein
MRGVRRLTTALAAVALAAAARLHAQADKPAEGLALQKARAETMEARGKKAYYDKQWDLSGLPAYAPEQKVTGTLRLWGSNYFVDGHLAEYWEKAFRRFHPDVTFDYRMKTTIAAVPSLVFGVGDIGLGRKITFHELLMFERYKDYDPLEIVVATGSYDVPGWQPGFGIVVHRDNPLTRITMAQLDGIFGAERLGGWEGTSWHPEYARGPEQNIRTWGQLGLTGEWKDKPITPYGLNARYHQATEISDRLLKSSDKWAERLRIYANYVSADGKLGRSLNDDLAKDRAGIAYVAAPTKNLPPELKVLEIAAGPGGPYVAYTIETLRDRSYPLHDEVYAYADRVPGRPLDPKVKEYLRFIVSREGQADVMRDGKYLPLTAAVVHEQLKRLE